MKHIVPVLVVAAALTLAASGQVLAKAPVPYPGTGAPTADTPQNKTALIDERAGLETDVASYDSEIALLEHQVQEELRMAASFQNDGNWSLAAACRGMAQGFRERLAEVRRKRDHAQLRLQEINTLLAR